MASTDSVVLEGWEAFFGRGPNKKFKNKQTRLKYAEIQEPSDLVCKLQLQ